MYGTLRAKRSPRTLRSLEEAYRVETPRRIHARHHGATVGDIHRAVNGREGAHMAEVREHGGVRIRKIGVLRAPLFLGGLRAQTPRSSSTDCAVAAARTHASICARSAPSMIRARCASLGAS